MKHIVCLFPAGGKKILSAHAAVLVLGIAISATSVPASTRPQYGGTLRVQMRERVANIDPRQWPSDSVQAANAERLASLIFDRLVRFDDRGVVQPALAVSWEHDATAKRWVFRLRTGVNFTDGMPFRPEIAALSLQQLLGNSFEVGATENSVIVQSERSAPNLLAQLASGRYYIFHAASDGTLAGTGPFRAESGASSPDKLIFTANESCWAGRPFVDRIEISMGMNYEQQLNAISFGQADVIELPAARLRQAVQRNVRTASSEPVDLFALEFNLARPFVQDIRIRRAISLAIDRDSLAGVVLQRQATIAGSLLPPWMSGYAPLFSATRDLPLANSLLAATRGEVSRPTRLVLIYDSKDDEARSLAERVSVNLREAGIMMQIAKSGAANAGANADIRLIRYRVSGPDPAEALASLQVLFGEPTVASDSPVSLESVEQCYLAERALMNTFRVVPLVHLSENTGLSSRVRDWMPPRWGGWRLDELWIAREAADRPEGQTKRGPDSGPEGGIR